MPKDIKAWTTTAWRTASAASLVATYNLASTMRRDKVRALAERQSTLLVRDPEDLACETVNKLIPFLQQTIRDVTDEVLSYEKTKAIIKQGLELEIFENFGEVVYVKKARVGDLLKILKIAPDKEEAFIKSAIFRGVLRESIYVNQKISRSDLSHRERNGHAFTQRSYGYPTRDRHTNNMERIVSATAATIRDGNPKIFVLCGTACNEDFWDLSDETSLALDLAERGLWVYLFTPRGLGRNKGHFDPNCTVDTEVSNDLPAAMDLLNAVYKEKQTILMGHSKGGFLAIFMLVRQAYKLNEAIIKITRGLGLAEYSIKHKKRPEIKAQLEQYETAIQRAGNNNELRSNLEKAFEHLARLQGVKGVNALGSPFAFDKFSHPIFGGFLSLNLALPALNQDAVPVDQGKWLAKTIPPTVLPAKMLINPKNFDDPEAFLRLLTKRGTDSFPLGVGWQMLKAIHSGRGIRRMAKDKFEYAKHLDLIPIDIPIYLIYGSLDILAPPFNLGFVDPAYANGSRINLARFSTFSHGNKVVYKVSSREDVDRLELPTEEASVVGIELANTNHLDLFYGKTGVNVGRPLIHKVNEAIWAAT